MNSQKVTTILLGVMILLLGGGGILIVKNSAKHGSAMGMTDSASASSTEALPVLVQTVTDQKGELGSLENTWPGEIISFGDTQIQPSRGGTIVEWNVNIGQKVYRGQFIARLSAPPAMPELTAMLAEQSKMLAEARTDSNAQIDFAQKRKSQLAGLLSTIEKTQTATASVTSSVLTSKTVTAAKNAAEADRQKIRAVLEQAISKELQLFSNIDIDFTSYYKLTNSPIIYLRDPLGHFNLNTRNAYLASLTKAARELNKDSGNIETVGTEYFEATTKMLAATFTGDDVTTDQLMEMRKMVSMDQMAFLETVKDAQMSKIEVAKMETDYAMQKKDIEEQVAMLDKDIAMNAGKVTAAEASYNTVAGSINGGLAVVSPVDGVISSVMKKNGDFVEPGMAIASVNNGKKTDRFVRFKIPSNIRQPEPGTKLVIVRPGFPNEMLRVKLIGVGTALDTGGSYMADAKFVDSVDWPVNVSVRVMPDFSASSTSSTIFVNAGALVWGDTNASVWIIKADNTITRHQIKTGRTLGDNVEVYDGLKLGDKYVGKIVTGLQEGISVKEGEVAKPAPTIGTHMEM